MSATELRLRRGTANQHSTFAGALGEITMDTDNITVRVHDGSTNGGIRLARHDELGSGAVSNTYLQLFIANTNSFITAVQNNDRAALANTNAFITSVQTADRAALANTNAYILTVNNSIAASAALGNTNLRIDLVNTNLTVTNTALRTLISDRVQVANVASLAALGNTNLAIAQLNTNLLATNTAIRSSIASGAALANTNAAIAQLNSNLTATNTAIRAAISTEVTNLIDAAPGTLDTLNELAAAVGDDPNFVTTMAGQLANTNTGISNLNTNLTATNTAIRTVIDSNLANTNAFIKAQLANTNAAIASVSAGAGANTGMDLPLGTPTDASLTTSGAYQSFTTSTKTTDAIDTLNEVIENVRNNTFVKSVSFVADQTSGGAGLVVQLTITAVGNANQFVIDWGDGSSNDTTASTTPTHTYSSNSGSPFTIQVTASNTSGSGDGSFATFSRSEYIVIATADPVVSFAAYAAPSGGSPITTWDDGATVYFQNNTTNIGSATIQFTWDWGDSSSDDVISSDSAAGGTAGARLAHTFTASTEQDVSRTVRLTLDAHNTADPSVIPTNTTNTFRIYDTHTPTVNLSSNTGINEESSSGHVVTFTNTTENTIGSHATFGIQYLYTFGDGDTQTVNVGSGANGDTGGTINHTYTLSASDQANGNAADYTGNLRVTSTHSSSPFISDSFTVHVEPDVRANITGTAVTVSDGSGDNAFTIYNHTDLTGANRALVRVTNSSQNGDIYGYAWGDGDTDLAIPQDGSTPGSVGATIDHDYTGESTGNYTVTLTANGTPDLTYQTDTESITYNMKAVPSAPANLSTKTISFSTSSVGTSPKLASGFTDNSTSNPLSAGASLTTSTARRYTSGTVTTTSASNAFNGAAGTLSAVINGSADGARTFTTSSGETGTTTSLVVSSQPDFNAVDASYPSNFYQVFTANISKAIDGLSTGVSDFRLEHSTTGNSNYVAMLKDNLTSVSSFGAVGTLAEGSGGSKRYISGIPYYNTGSPTLTLSGTTVSNLVGQAYTDQSNIVEIDSDTNEEGTSSSAFSNQNYSYSDIDGASTMLSSGVPVVNTGVASPYTIGNLSIPITSSSVRTIDTAKIRVRNVNGISSYSSIAGKIQVHTASQSGIVEQAIAVSDSLGSTFDDDGVRIFDLSAATADTPSFNGSTNFYTNSLYSESSDPGVAGTKEATIRLGIIKHDVTNYSSGYLPVGPNRSGDTGTQYFTFAFRRQTVANFDLNIVSTTGIAGCFIAAPGTDIDSASGLNGWLDTSITYAGSGVPGSDTGNGGNGSNGCAFTTGDRISTGSSLSGSFTLTLGSENMSNATGNVVLVRFALTSGQSITSVSVGVAS